jgi:HSP20 family protein
MASIIRWEPFRELAALQNDMGRLMGAWLGEGNGDVSRQWVPAVDVWETNDEVVYAFDLPGIPQDQISVEYEDGALTVSAERTREHKVEQDQFTRYERRFGTFARTVGLPQGVTEDQIRAEYRDGVLELHVAKPEQQKPRRIPVGGQQQARIEGSSHQTA